MSGLVQQPDKIVVRSAHTIYPYSLGIQHFPEQSRFHVNLNANFAGIESSLVTAVFMLKHIT
jgi:hypothetical protein